MSNRWLIALLGAAAVTLAGCSSPTPTVTTPKSTTKTSAAADQSTESPSASPSESSSDDTSSAPLDGEACVEVTGANLDLATASTSDAARTAADTLEKYEPPQSTQEAIEHFVKTGGAQFDDPDFQKYNDTIDKWVKQVCP